MNTLQLVLITGMSGSGKSVALAALEDVGYYCVDNLPPELMVPFVQLQEGRTDRKVAVAIDARSKESLPHVPQLMAVLAGKGVHVSPIFLDASDDTLVRRFSETRRGHPLSSKGTGNTDSEPSALLEAIQLERQLTQNLRERAVVIDTSLIKPAKLLSQIKDLVGSPKVGLTLVFESFAFKRGIPLDADFVFDVRMLPNPHYDPALRPLTGRDAPVAAFLEQQAEVSRMKTQISAFLTSWLPALKNDHRSYVTVAVGCTGGQHRSVYLVEKLAKEFAADWNAKIRHREL